MEGFLYRKEPNKSKHLINGNVVHISFYRKIFKILVSYIFFKMTRSAPCALAVLRWYVSPEYWRSKRAGWGTPVFHLTGLFCVSTDKASKPVQAGRHRSWLCLLSLQGQSFIHIILPQPWPNFFWTLRFLTAKEPRPVQELLREAVALTLSMHGAELDSRKCFVKCYC